MLMVSPLLPSATADWERAMVKTPIEECLYRYGGNMDPAWSLTIAVATIAFLRWQTVKAANSGINVSEIMKAAAQQTVEVKP
jgi:hypothetical protein